MSQGGWVRAGLASVIQGESVVEGVSTAWAIAGVVPGDIFIGPDGNLYEILTFTEGDITVDLREQITIKSLTGIEYYLSDTATSDYAIVRNWSNTTNANLASRISYLLDSYDSQVQELIDNTIDTWYYTYTPGRFNEPFTNWIDDTERDKHIGDLFYNTTTNTPYRLEKENSIHSWVSLEDPNIQTALENASAASEAVDGKITIFSEEPYGPYSVGDLWDTGNGLWKANIARISGFALTDWGIISDVTGDNTSANTNYVGSTAAELIVSQAAAGADFAANPSISYELITGDRPPINADKTPSMLSDEDLVVYWSFDEGSGNAVRDSTFSRIDTTAFSRYAAEELFWEPGISGSCTKFDRSNLLYFDNTDFIPLTTLSWSCWFKSTGLDPSTTMGTHVKNGIGGLSSGSYSFWVDSLGKVSFDIYTADTLTSVYDNEWHHAVFTFDGLQIKIYIDNILGLTETYIPSGILPTQGFIGTINSTLADNCFYGSIDEVRIYSKALSEEEITALYNTPGGNKASTALDTIMLNGVPAIELTTRLTETETVAVAARDEFLMMADDDYLSVGEKKKIRADWPELNAEYAALITKASAYSIVDTALQTAYLALSACLVDSLNVWSSMDTGNYFAGFSTLMNQYHAEYSTLYNLCFGASEDKLDFAYDKSMAIETVLDNILDDDVINLSEKVILRDELDLIEIEYPHITAQASIVDLSTVSPYDTIYVYPYMLAYANYNASLVDATLNMLGADATGGTQLREHSAVYYQTRAALVAQIGTLTRTLPALDTEKVGGVVSSEIVQNITDMLNFADTSEELFDDMASDSRLTPAEKTSWRSRYLTVDIDYDTMIDLATKYNIPSVTLTAAKDALDTYLIDTCKVWFSPNTTTSVPDLATKLSDYYTAYNNLFIIKQTVDSTTNNNVDEILEKIEDGSISQKVIRGYGYLRSETIPEVPIGGTYENPIPTEWPETILPGTFAVYQTTRIFTSDGLAPQQTVWSTPYKIWEEPDDITKDQLHIDLSSTIDKIDFPVTGLVDQVSGLSIPILFTSNTTQAIKTNATFSTADTWTFSSAFSEGAMVQVEVDDAYTGTLHISLNGEDLTQEKFGDVDLEVESFEIDFGLEDKTYEI